MKVVYQLLFCTAAWLSVATVQASEELAKSKNCLTCHAVESKRVGPAYKDVAKKYAGNSDAMPMLVEKVMKGGGGTWGGMPMPPNPNVSKDEAKVLVEWILNLK